MELLTVTEVAKILKCNNNYVYQLHKAGLLQLIKLGSLKCRAEWLADFVEKYKDYDLTNPFDIKKLGGEKNEKNF